MYGDTKQIAYIPNINTTCGVSGRLHRPATLFSREETPMLISRQAWVGHRAASDMMIKFQSLLETELVFRPVTSHHID
jgi:hypothetical protein